VTLATHTDIYKSLVVSGQQTFSNVTLFPGRSLEEVPKSALWTSLENHLKGLKPDVIFIYGYSDSIFRRAKQWAGRNNAATVLISDTNTFDRSRSRLLELIKSLYVRRFDAAFVGGESSSAYLQTLGFPSDRIKNGYDVVDNAYFQQQSCRVKQQLSQTRLKWNLPSYYFLFVGRLVAQKNLFLLMDAYDKYLRALAPHTTPWKLVICGNGPEEEKLRKYVIRIRPDYSKHVLFYGLVKQPELVDFYSSASCLVLPSISESWGLVINEAMACGLPVIASQRCGCSIDLVKPGVNGWVFDPSSSSELASLMTQLHALDPAERAVMCSRSEEIISAWGLDTFSHNALECAELALKHRNSRRHRRNFT
jgi:glycosyltransferase involved in cell wall biosynthesis